MTFLTNLIIFCWNEVCLFYMNPMTLSWPFVNDVDVMAFINTLYCQQPSVCVSHQFPEFFMEKIRSQNVNTRPYMMIFVCSSVHHRFANLTGCVHVLWMHKHCHSLIKHLQTELCKFHAIFMLLIYFLYLPLPLVLSVKRTV